jgi:hypothetical protein
VGTKPGLLPRTLELVVVGSKSLEREVELEPLEAGAVVVHRWPGYVPWTVFGGGLAVAGVGGLVALLGQDQMRTYDKIVDERCTGRCTADELADVASLKSGAELKSTLGVGLAITGGVAVVTGAVMLYLNRGRTVYPEVTPTAGGAAISFGGRF